MQLSALPRSFFRLRRTPGLSPEALRRLRWMQHDFERGRSSPLPQNTLDKAFPFTAIDICSRMRVLRAFSTNSSRRAAAFLHDMRRAFSFPLQNIQSDNGREFLGSFPP